MPEASAATPLDGSLRWAEELRRGGREREQALIRLRAHLVAAALFEVRRRQLTCGCLEDREAERLARDAAETALAAIVAELGRYRGQSAFATWTAKYAIRAAAAAARAALAPVDLVVRDRRDSEEARRDARTRDHGGGPCR